MPRPPPPRREGSAKARWAVCRIETQLHAKVQQVKTRRLLRTVVGASVGELPAFELRNRVLWLRGSFDNANFQAAEVRRLRATLGRGTPPSAGVAVVIPTYNRPELLRESITSALAQTYEDIVVIVVDDGGGLPPDLPSDPRLISVSLSRNTATLGLVRNVGMHLTESEFIAFLDDDNTWEPDHLEVTIQALKANADLGAVYTTVRCRRPDGSVVRDIGGPFDRRRLKRHAYVDANSIVVRRTGQPGFSVMPRVKTTHPKEDWEYLWRLSRRQKVVHIPKITVRYLRNPGSYFTDWKGQ